MLDDKRRFFSFSGESSAIFKNSLFPPLFWQSQPFGEQLPDVTVLGQGLSRDWDNDKCLAIGTKT
jgi:hypothetical protein